MQVIVLFNSFSLIFFLTNDPKKDADCIGSWKFIPWQWSDLCEEPLRQQHLFSQQDTAHQTDKFNGTLTLFRDRQSQGHMVVIGLTRHLSDNKLTCVLNDCKAGTDLCEVYRGLPVIMGWFHLLITLRVARERFWQREACEQLREERWTGPKDAWISLVISWVDLADKTVFVSLADGKRIQYPQIISVNMTHLQQNDY